MSLRAFSYKASSQCRIAPQSLPHFIWSVTRKLELKGLVEFLGYGSTNAPKMEDIFHLTLRAISSGAVALLRK